MDKLDERYKGLGGVKEYQEREKWAIDVLSKNLEWILGEFRESEQATIRPKLANYTMGYLGVSYGIKYG